MKAKACGSILTPSPGGTTVLMQRSVAMLYQSFSFPFAVLVFYSVCYLHPQNQGKGKRRNYQSVLMVAILATE